MNNNQELKDFYYNTIVPTCHDNPNLPKPWEFIRIKNGLPLNSPPDFNDPTKKFEMAMGCVDSKPLFAEDKLFYNNGTESIAITAKGHLELLHDELYVVVQLVEPQVTPLLHIAAIQMLSWEPINAKQS